MTAAAEALTKGSLCSGYGGLDLATPGSLRMAGNGVVPAAAAFAQLDGDEQ